MRRLLDLLFPPRRDTASIARERLKIVLAHERASRDAPDFLPMLQKELLDVVSRYLEITPEMIRVNVGKSGETSLLEINVEIDGAKARPGKPEAATAAPPKPVGATPAKPAEIKPAEIKPAEIKPAEIKPAPGKPAEAKPAEAKPAIVRAYEAGESAPWVKPG